MPVVHLIMPGRAWSWGISPSPYRQSRRRRVHTISGLLVALSWKRPPDSARSMLPLSQNSDSSHVSCTWTKCYI